MPDEQTVRGVINDWDTDGGSFLELADALGLDLTMSVAQLRADLAIAKRARETEPLPFLVGGPNYGRSWADGYNACLDHILGSTT